jgi:hypothetical protein
MSGARPTKPAALGGAAKLYPSLKIVDEIDVAAASVPAASRDDEF